MRVNLRQSDGSVGVNLGHWEGRCAGMVSLFRHWEGRCAGMGSLSGIGRADVLAWVACQALGGQMCWHG